MKEIERRKAESLREEKLIQRIREESEELRELEAKLKAAYVSKERQVQMAEKQTRTLEERVHCFGATFELSVAEQAVAA